MPKLFRKGGSMVGDVALSAAALTVALAVMAVARSTFWHPMRAGRYPFVAVVSAIAWVTSRVYPKTTLIVVAAVVAWSPEWGIGAFELCTIPLAVAGFRAAVAGAPVAFVVPVVGISAAMAQLPNFGQVQTFLEYGSRLLDWFYDPSRRLMIAIVLAVILALGYAMHGLRSEASDLASRNEQLIRLQVSESQRVAAEVRTAIARDLHDVVAHHVTAMVVRAQAAERVADLDPGKLREAVQAIADEGNDALAAMRRTVKMLRSGGSSPMLEPMSFRAAVDGLIEPLRSSGRQVEVDGDISGAGELVQLTVLWILQEALTNVMLHSGSHLIGVQLTDAPEIVEMTVRDSGPSSSPAGMTSGGNGIHGMKERAAAVGGRVSVGPAAGSAGWTVHAVLPRTTQPSLA
jgi:signal transduction histidine kinase